MVRVLLIDLPGLLQAILEDTIVAAEGLELISGDQHDTVYQALFAHRPDVLVTDGDRGELWPMLHQLSDCPARLKLVTLNDNGRRAWLYDVSLTRHDLGAPTPSSLVETITGRTQGRPET